MTEEFPELRLLIERLDGKMDRLGDKVDNLSAVVAKYEMRISAIETQHKIDWGQMRDRYHELTQIVQLHMPFAKQLEKLETDVSNLKEDLVERRGSSKTLVAISSAIGVLSGVAATILVRMLT